MASEPVSAPTAPLATVSPPDARIDVSATLSLVSCIGHQSLGPGHPLLRPRQANNAFPATKQSVLFVQRRAPKLRTIIRTIRKAPPKALASREDHHELSGNGWACISRHGRRAVVR